MAKEKLSDEQVELEIQRLQELLAEFYEDREVQEVHLDERLKSMGFDIRDGRVFSLEDQDGNFVKKKKEVGADG